MLQILCHQSASEIQVSDFFCFLQMWYGSDMQSWSFPLSRWDTLIRVFISSFSRCRIDWDRPPRPPSSPRGSRWASWDRRVSWAATRTSSTGLCPRTRTWSSSWPPWGTRTCPRGSGASGTPSGWARATRWPPCSPRTRSVPDSWPWWHSRPKNKMNKQSIETHSSWESFFSCSLAKYFL